MTKEEFRRSIGPLVLVCNQPPDAEKLAAYFRLLQDVDAGALEVACLRHAQSCEDGWFPSVGRLRAMAAEHKHGRLVTCDEAWAAVLAIVRRVGTYATREQLQALDDSTRKALAAAGGYRAICDMEDRTRGVVEAEFRRAYTNATAKVAESRTVHPKLIPHADLGQSAISRLAEGLSVSKIESN